MYICNLMCGHACTQMTHTQIFKQAIISALARYLASVGLGRNIGKKHSLRADFHIWAVLPSFGWNKSRHQKKQNDINHSKSKYVFQILYFHFQVFLVKRNRAWFRHSGVILCDGGVDNPNLFCIKWSNIWYISLGGTSAVFTDPKLDEAASGRTKQCGLEL